MSFLSYVQMVDAPEIEKEVKRLLRVDNEAESVRFEILTEEDERIKEEDSSKLPYGEDSKFTSGIGEISLSAYQKPILKFLLQSILIAKKDVSSRIIKS